MQKSKVVLISLSTILSLTVAASFTLFLVARCVPQNAPQDSFTFLQNNNWPMARLQTVAGDYALDVEYGEGSSIIPNDTPVSFSGTSPFESNNFYAFNNFVNDGHICFSSSLATLKSGGQYPIVINIFDKVINLNIDITQPQQNFNAVQLASNWPETNMQFPIEEKNAILVIPNAYMLNFVSSSTEFSISGPYYPATQGDWSDGIFGRRPTHLVDVNPSQGEFAIKFQTSGQFVKDTLSVFTLTIEILSIIVDCQCVLIGQSG